MNLCTRLLLPVIVVGLVGIADGKKAAPELNAGSQLAQSLQSAHKLLAEADHDYHGHRAEAEHKVHMALKEMGLTSAVRETKVRSGKSHEREPQAASDAKLREAQKILEGISTTGNPAVAEHVKGAIKEINTALSIH